MTSSLRSSFCIILLLLLLLLLVVVVVVVVVATGAAVYTFYGTRRVEKCTGVIMEIIIPVLGHSSFCVGYRIWCCVHTVQILPKLSAPHKG
jgi:hypothetical protein